MVPASSHCTAMTLVLFLATLLIVPALFLLLRRALVRKRGLWPPGPPVLPIIGHLHLLGSLPHQSLCNLSLLHGPLMGLHLGRVPTIVASSPDMAKAILQTHDLTFSFRPPSAAGVHMFFNSANLGNLPHGPLFKRLRQLLASELFSLKRLEAFRYVREEEVRELMRSILQMVTERPHDPIELRASLLAVTNNINWRMATGKKIRETYTAMDGKKDVLSLVEEVMHLMGVFNVGDFVPWLAWLDLQGYVKRMKGVGHRAAAMMQTMIDKRREAHKAMRYEEGQAQHLVCGPNNLLDVMLQTAAQNAQGNNTTAITDDNIKGLLLDLFAGGSDTSSSTVEWALADLINNPEAMHKVQEELDRVVGKARIVEEMDIQSLPYLGIVLKESMRLHPVAPLLLPHEAAHECQIFNYKIPPKTRAYVNTWAIGRDPTIWERPLDFWPERFQGNNVDKRGQSFELLPFGFGRRSCPAATLGLLNVHLMLATLVQAFTWSVSSCNNPSSNSSKHLIDMSERFDTALVMAKPLCLFATQRLALDLY